MRKSEMNDWQLEDRDSFVNRLTAAGWEARGWEVLFAAENELTPEAQAEYQNSAFKLRCSYFVAHEYLLLEAVANVGELALALRLYPAGGCKQLLDAIIASQETLSDENYSEFIEKAKPLCSHIVLETADKLVEIT